MEPMNSPGDLAQNMPNASLMYSTLTPTFGNIMFAIQPSMSGEINDQYGQIPYLSLESLIYMQQVQAATNSANTSSGSVTGQQNVTGAITVTGGSGNVQVAIGSATTATGTF